MRVMLDRRNSNDTATRRPSQARIRKSISKNSSKRVTWCPTEASVQQLSQDPYNGVENEEIWYSREELRSIRISNEFTVMDFQESNNDWRKHDEEAQTIRGLESWTDQGSWERFKHHRDCLNRVLDEQDRQRGIDKTEFQQSHFPIVKRINHLHIPFDHERLGALSRDATAKARRVALLRGRRDFLEMKEGSYRTLSFKRQRPLVTKPQEQETADNETATVQTEAMTVVDDMLTVEDDSQVDDSSSSSAVVEELPLPIVVSYSPPAISAESLLEQKNARYAQYLANRQQRIEARERAEYEWEERRLARKAVIRKEADEHLAKMRGMLRQRAELLARVQARA